MDVLITQALGLLLPVFVAMDPIGALPLIAAWTGELPREKRRQQLRDAFVTALTLGLLFVVGGRWLFAILGVDVPDFLVAGGLVLLVLAISDLVVGGTHEGRGSLTYPDFGVVPIGTPLLAGPATLTTLVVLVQSYGLLWTILTLCLNLVLAWWMFTRAGAATRIFGRNGLRAGSKVASLILAAIAVKLIRQGIVAILAGMP